jgi:hypothetical protein
VISEYKSEAFPLGPFTGQCHVVCSYLLDAEVRSIRGILENANSSRTNCVNLVCLTSTDLAAQ